MGAHHVKIVPRANKIVLASAPNGDGRWVLRSVLRFRMSSGDEGTARVLCIYVRVPDQIDPPKFDPFGVESPVIHLGWEPAGTVPILIPNSIVQNGQLCGTLPFVTKTITISAESLEHPEFVNGRIFARSEERIWFARYQGNCDGRRQIVDLPCSEIIRQTIAVSSHFAAAIFSGPWLTAMQKILDVAACSANFETNSWHLALRHRTSFAHAELAGHLLFDSGARKAINELSAFATASGGEIRLPLPIRAVPLQLVIHIHPNIQAQTTLRATRLEAVRRLNCPVPKITFTKPWGASAEGARHDEVPDFFCTSGPEINPNTDRVFEAAHDPDSQSNSSVTHFEGDSFALDVFRATPEKQVKDAKISLVGRQFPNGSTTVGASGLNGDPVDSVARFSVGRSGSQFSDRFSALMAELNYLENCGTISDLSVVAPAQDAELMRGEYPCWPFRTAIVDHRDTQKSEVTRERSRTWGFLSRRPDRVRTALVVTFNRPKCRIFWIEIDVRVDNNQVPTEKYASTLICVGHTRICDMGCAVTEIDDLEGRVTKQRTIANFVAGRDLWFFKHRVDSVRVHGFNAESIARKLANIEGP